MESAAKKQKISRNENEELRKLIPLLKTMEQNHSLLNCVLSAFRDQEDLLVQKLKAHLPDTWISAPDQRMILKKNWVIHDDNGKGKFDDGLVLKFKDGWVELGLDGGRTVSRKDISASATHVECCTFERDRCEECPGKECSYDFDLQYNPKRNDYKLFIEERVTCECELEDEDSRRWIAYMA